MLCRAFISPFARDKIPGPGGARKNHPQYTGLSGLVTKIFLIANSYYPILYICSGCTQSGKIQVFSFLLCSRLVDKRDTLMGQRLVMENKSLATF